MSSRLPPLPGFGLPLNAPLKNKEGYHQHYFPSALTLNLDSGGSDGRGLPALTLREIAMLEFMNKVTDKKGWEIKVFDTAITEKWREEIENTTEHGFTENMFNHCIDELKHKARLFKSQGFVSVFNGDVVKSDVAIPQDLQLALKQAVAPLENVSANKPDWHPGSNEEVLDLVHPSLFPLVYGHSRILSEVLTDLDNCVTLCGDGDVAPIPPQGETLIRTRAPQAYSKKFQWLPCDVDVSGEVPRISSYINNLHPKEHESLYEVIEKIMARVIPLWNATLTPLWHFNFERRIQYSSVDYDEEAFDAFVEKEGPKRRRRGKEADQGEQGEHVDENEEEQGDQTDENEEKQGENHVNNNGEVGDEDEHEEAGDEDEEDEDEDDEEDEDDDSAGEEDETDSYYEYLDRLDEWKADHREQFYIQPDARPFSLPHEGEQTIDLERDYAINGIQVIVKLANIQLTPEKPKYAGGTWHVEGQLNEHICATAIYYYDCENISSSLLAFRQAVSGSEFDDGISYNQDDHGWLGTIFGLRNWEPGIQQVGCIEAIEGRLVTFPNLLQHQVQPFELADPTKPGHRKILALFLVDPNLRIISTANVPCQRLDWWADAVASNEAQGLAKFPPEIRSEILKNVEDFPISLEAAKELREELMAERKEYVLGYQTELFTTVQIALCEH